MKPVTLFVAGLFLLFTPPAYAWEDGDKTAYLEKLDVLQNLVREAAAKPDNLREVCLLMSIGNDVNRRYLELNADDAEERERQGVMADQLSTCLAGLYLRQKAP